MIGYALAKKKPRTPSVDMRQKKGDGGDIDTCPRHPNRDSSKRKPPGNCHTCRAIWFRHGKPRG